MELNTPDTEKVVHPKKIDGTLVKLQLREIKAYKNNAKIHTEEQTGKTGVKL